MADDSPAKPDEPWVKLTCSPHLADWLAAEGVSLALTTYQTGKLFLIGRNAAGQIAVFERTFNRAMGVWSDGQTLWLATHYQLWRFENVLPVGQHHQGADRLYVPRVAYTTGDLDVHDVCVDAGGRVVFAATLFNTLATVSDRHSFRPLWRPPFVSALVAEDRCHLNGLALDGGKPRYVTAVSATDTIDGWRERRRDGGVLVEVPSGRIVASGFSMPHSPRRHRGRVWLLDSGTGRLGSLRPDAGSFEPVAFCPGYLRGLALRGDFAVVGLSRPRRDGTFGGLALDDELKRRGQEAVCGLDVIDLQSGQSVHWLRMEGLVTELYDVAILPGVVRPLALGFKTDEILRTIAVGEEAPLSV